jgi:hypothetical protein
MEFESTEGKKAPRSHVCVVYDRDGRIVHGHVFVGDGTGLFGPEGREERELETLEGARRNHGDVVSRLRVLHAPASFRFIPNVAYRVDTKSGRLVEYHKRPPETLRPKTAPTKKEPVRKRKT